MNDDRRYLTASERSIPAAIRSSPTALAPVAGDRTGLATVAGLAVWFGMGEKYTASSFLVLDIQEKSVLTGPVTAMDRDRFEIFKSTQQGKLLSRFVLLAAMRNKPDVAKTQTVLEEQQRGGDPVGRLQKLLSVNFPGKAEFMEVSITRSDPHEAQVLVNAVVDSYLSDVAGAERNQRLERLNKLESACAAKDLEIRNTRQELRSLAQINGSRDGDGGDYAEAKDDLDEYAPSVRNWRGSNSRCGGLGRPIGGTAGTWSRSGFRRRARRRGGHVHSIP